MRLGNVLYPSPNFEWLALEFGATGVKMPDGSIHPLKAGSTLRCYNQDLDLVGYTEFGPSTKRPGTFGMWHCPVYGQYYDRTTQKVYHPVGLVQMEKYFVLADGYFVGSFNYRGGAEKVDFAFTTLLDVDGTFTSFGVGQVAGVRGSSALEDISGLSMYISSTPVHVGNHIFPYWGCLSGNTDGPDIEDFTLLQDALFISSTGVLQQPRMLAEPVQAMSRPTVGVYTLQHSNWVPPSER